MKKILAVFIVLISVVYGAAVHAGEKEKAGLGFVVMGDNRPASIFRPEQPYVYHKVVRQAVALDPVLILNTGDIILGYDAETRVKAADEFEGFEKASLPIRNSGIPLYITMGNHSGYSDFARGEFRERYGDRATGKLYYSVDAGNAHFINLCTELENEESRITGAQLQWLRNDLKKAQGKNIFVLLHRPLYPRIKHFKDSLNIYPEQRDALAGLLKDHGVDMVFAGHVHVYNYSVFKGLGQIIAGGSGAPLAGSIEQGGFNHFFHVMVNENDVDYRLIPVSNEVLEASRMMREKRVEAALILARKALDTVPGHPMPWIIAASCYKLLGDAKNYNKSFKRLVSILGSEREVFFRLGEFCLASDMLDLSGTCLSMAMEHDRESFKVVYHLAELKKKQKLYSHAIEMYKKALTLTRDKYYVRKIRKNIKKIEENEHKKA